MIDRILWNGNIHTFNTAYPHATALAIIGERIVAVGSDDDIKALADSSTQIDNLNGRFVMPSMVDAHIHWANTAKYRNAVDLFEVPTKAEALERIQQRAASIKPNEWLFGSGWAQAMWTPPDFPTRADLDAVTGNIPTYLVTKSGHAAWVNSAALRIAGVTANTPEPDGGKINRDARGEPDGILLEAPAMKLVSQHMPSITPEQLAEWMVDVQQDAWAVGLTGIHDFDGPACLTALQLLRERGELGMRVVKQINDPYIEHAHALGLRTNFGDHWLRIGALKIFADGALGPKTAAMIEPYENEPDNYGVVVTDKETIYELVSQASRLGLPSSIHAIGDKAVHDVLDVFDAVRKEEAAAGIPRAARRHRIEHVQIIHPSDMHRLGELDVIASMQPIHATSDMDAADAFWGERAQYSYHWRGQLDAGAVLAFGSDSPIDPFDTFKGLHAAVNRRRVGGEIWYPQAKISIQEALHAYTLGAAYAGGMEKMTGQLASGFLADLVILNQDLLQVPSDAILETQVLGTMLGGEWKYRIFD